MHPIRDDLLPLEPATCRKPCRRVRRLIQDVDDLLHLPPLRQQCRLLHPRSRFLNRPVVEELLRRAAKVGFRDAPEAGRICQLAWEICIWLGRREGTPGEIRDLKALTAAHWGNVGRLLHEWQKAGRRFETAYDYLRLGTGDLRIAATVQVLHASLLKDTRQLEQALKVLEQARTQYENLGDLHNVGKTSLNRAAVLRLQGEPEQAYHEHLRACGLLDEDREPHLAGAAWINLALFCCYRGHHREALSVLEGSPDLRDLCGRDSTILLNQHWVWGKTLHGLGDFARAEQKYLEARAGFTQRSYRYNEGLINLDLALLYAQEGRLDELAETAEAAFRALSREPLQDEARVALLLFVEAVRKRQAVEILRAALARFHQEAQAAACL